MIQSLGLIAVWWICAYVALRYIEFTDAASDRDKEICQTVRDLE